MKRLKLILRLIFRLPLIPFIMLLIIYITYKIFANTNISEINIRHEKNEGILTDEFKEYYTKKIKENMKYFNFINFILWLFIIYKII